MDFDTLFSRGIPFEKAAAFYCNLKHGWQVMPPEDDQLMARAIKLASETPALTSPGGQGTALASPAPGEEDGLRQYLELEQAGQAAEEQNSVEYYQSLLEQMRSELAAATQQAQEATQRAEQVEALQAEHQSQLASAQQEGQIAQQAALQQVHSANQSAAQAMQQAVDAENRALQAKSQEATAKIQQQQVRSQLFDLASQGLPGSEPELGGAGNAAEGLSQEQPPETPGGAPQGAEDPNAAAPGTDLNQQGEAATAEGMPGQEAATEAPAAAAPPGSPQPPGDSSGAVNSGTSSGPQANSDGSAAAPEQDPTAKRTGQVSIKVGGADPVALTIAERLKRLQARRGEKVAGVAELARDPRVVGAVTGGLAGAGLTATEALGRGPDLNKLRARIAEHEQATAQPGVRGFMRAFDLAKDRALLTLGEATQTHPLAATAVGGAMGAAAGAKAGPELVNLAREAASLHR